MRKWVITPILTTRAGVNKSSSPVPSSSRVPREGHRTRGEGSATPYFFPERGPWIQLCLVQSVWSCILFVGCLFWPRRFLSSLWEDLKLSREFRVVSISHCYWQCWLRSWESVWKTFLTLSCASLITILQWVWLFVCLHSTLLLPQWGQQIYHGKQVDLFSQIRSK